MQGDGPPVMRITLPSREGRSFKGLKSTRPLIAGIVLWILICVEKVGDFEKYWFCSSLEG